MQAGLDDNLNTAQAHAAIFDMVRNANAALDAGELKRDDVVRLGRTGELRSDLRGNQGR